MKTDECPSPTGLPSDFVFFIFGTLRGHVAKELHFYALSVFYTQIMISVIIESQMEEQSWSIKKQISTHNITELTEIPFRKREERRTFPRGIANVWDQDVQHVSNIHCHQSCHRHLSQNTEPSSFQTTSKRQVKCRFSQNNVDGECEDAGREHSRSTACVNYKENAVLRQLSNGKISIKGKKAEF